MAPSARQAEEGGLLGGYTRRTRSSGAGRALACEGGACCSGRRARARPAAACAVRMWCDRGGGARLVTAKRLLDDVRDGYHGDGDRGALERAARVPLLALDDLGLERRTDWGVEEISALIDGRTAAGLPTVITSNYSLGELATALGRGGRRPRGVEDSGGLRAHRGRGPGQEAPWPGLTRSTSCCGRSWPRRASGRAGARCAAGPPR
ncbi:MAG: hypothetical protein ACLTKG_03630 [Collinsella intestinalis]